MGALKLMRGGEFVLDVPDQVPAVWGCDDAVLHAKGEALMIVGGSGVGKTTIAQQYALRRAGVLSGPLLGYPVEVDGRPVLYVAADRPEQARRSMHRMVDAEHREALDKGLIVWRGPLPFNLVQNPRGLLDWASEMGVGTVFIDSLKDVAIGLTDDAVGAAVNQAAQFLVSEGIELGLLHHQRKSQQPGTTRTIEDVYGSGWLTAGMGSVVMIDGNPGDQHVKLRHLKQPMGVVGPLTVQHDHSTGTSTVEAVSGPDGSFRPTWLMEQTSRAVEADPGISTRVLEDLVKGKGNEFKRLARKLLSDEGFIDERNGARGAKRYFSLKPYRQDDDVQAIGAGTLGIYADEEVTA